MDEHPEWSQIGGRGSAIYEAADASGEVWRLELGEGAWLLFVKNQPNAVTPIPAERGIYHVMDVAGWIIRQL
jgi:hypothetical protein